MTYRLHSLRSGLLATASLFFMAATPHTTLADFIPNCLGEDQTLCDSQSQQHATASDEDHQKLYHLYLNDISGDISELSPETIDWAFKNLPDDKWQELNLADLTEPQLSGLSPKAGDNISRSMLAKLSPKQISWISPQAFGKIACNLGWFSLHQIWAITSRQMGVIDPLCALRLPQVTLSCFSQTQICNFSPETFSALSTHLELFPHKRISEICQEQIQKIPALAVMNWSPDIIQKFSQAQMGFFSPEALEAWTLRYIDRIEKEGTGLNELGPNNIASLTSQAVMRMDSETLQTLPSYAIHWLSDDASKAFALRCKEWTVAQVSALGDRQLPFVRWQDIAELSPEILQRLSGQQLGLLNEQAYDAFLDHTSLTNDQISELDSKHVERIQARHIKDMKNEPLAGLWNQIPVMSQEQVAALQENTELPDHLSSLIAARLWQHENGLASLVNLQESDVWDLPVDVVQGFMKMYTHHPKIADLFMLRLSLLETSFQPWSPPNFSQAQLSQIPWEYLNRFTKEQIQAMEGNVCFLSSSTRTSLYKERYDDLTWQQATLLYVTNVF